MTNAQQVGTVKVELNFRLMRDERDKVFILMNTNGDEALLFRYELNDIRDFITEQLVDVGVTGFEVEIKKS